MKKLYTVKEVANLLGFSTNSVYKYLDEGKIKSTRLGKGGRFRIPSGEVNRLLQKEKGEVIGNLIPVKLLKLASNLKSVPSLCDWFVAILALALGLSQFIFPNYFSDTTFVRYLLVIKYLKVALLGTGGVLIVLGVIGWQKKVWMKIVRSLLTLLFLVIAGFYFRVGYIPEAIGYVSVAVIMIISAFQKYNEYEKFLILVNFLIFFTGIGFLIHPNSFGIGLFTASLSQAKPLFVFLWLIIFVSSILWSLKVAKKDGNIRFLFSLVVSLASIIYASLAFSGGYWESAIYSIILASFSLIFPFWVKFEAFAQSSKKQLVGSFIWFMALFLIGSLVLVFVYRSFESYLFSELQRRLDTASQFVETFMQNNENRILVFSENNEFVNLMQNVSGDTSGIEKTLRSFYLASNGAFKRIIAVSPEGKVITNYPYLPESIGVDLSDRDFYQAVSNGDRKLYISGIIKPSTHGLPPTVLITAPIVNQSGKVLGVLEGSADLKYLSERLNEIKFGEEGTFLIVDSKYDYIVNPQEKLVLTQANEGSAARKAIDDSRGRQIKAYDSSGVLSLIAYKKIDSLNWGIIAQQPFSEVFRNYSIAGFVIFLVLVMTGVGSLIFVIRARRI